MLFPLANERFRLRHCPRWNYDGGLLYPVQGHNPSTQGPTPLYRFKPSIHSLSEPLLGASVVDTYLRKRRVRYPHVYDRIKMFLEGIEILIAFPFEAKENIVTLAAYRRQVSQAGMRNLDALFLEVADAIDPTLSDFDWQNIGQRMPHRSWIQKECVERSLREEVALFSEAAE